MWFGLPKETGTKFDALNELLFTFLLIFMHSIIVFFPPDQFRFD